MANKAPEEALPALTPAAAGALDIWITLHAERDHALIRAFGAKLKRSFLADAIMDLMLRTFGLAGATLPLSAYQRACAGIASANGVRIKAYEMQEAGVLRVMPSSKDQRGSTLVPTRATVEFCNLAAPVLLARAWDLISKVKQAHETD